MSKQEIPVPPGSELDERRRLCEADVTLNGEPARISGARNRFATVRQTGSGLSAEWAWPTAKRIVASGGSFITEQRSKRGPYPAMRPAKSAYRPSCLVMNPQNARASETRRAKLLAAFDTLGCNDRADFLELAETISSTALPCSNQRHEIGVILHRMYAAAGLE